MIAIAGFVLLAAFLVTAITRRAHRQTALAIGSLPAVLMAAAAVENLNDPLVWFYILAIWLPLLASALAGAWLGKLVHAYWRRA